MSNSERPHETNVDQIQRTLIRRILRREYAAGANLPSVRALADEFGVTAPTIQRVIAALEAHRVVEARHGSGVRILDPARHGSLSLLPAWFDSLFDQPEEAARVFAESMELRRLVAMLLARRIGAAQLTPGFARALADVRDAEGPAALMEADLRLTRAVLESAGHFGATALFNTVETVFRDVPEIAEAVYGNPTLVRESLETIGKALTLGGERSVLAVGEALERWDRAATRRFEEIVRRSSRGHAPPRISSSTP